MKFFLQRSQHQNLQREYYEVTRIFFEDTYYFKNTNIQENKSCI